MSSTAKSMRLQIAVFGRTNTGKSSFINLLTGQQISITSDLAGTTTDIVEKTMEFAPAGPVLFIDTAGLDDQSPLGSERIKRTEKVFERADIAVLVTTANIWGTTEEKVAAAARKRGIKLITVINQCDKIQPDEQFKQKLQSFSDAVITSVTLPGSSRDQLVNDFRQALLANLPEDFLRQPPLLGDLIQPGSLIVMIVPIDLQAPRGRLIMPQVQAIRDALDHDAMILAVKENRYPELIKNLNIKPGLVVCDSQVVKLMIENTPSDIPCTTFSVLFSRLKGDTNIFMQGCRAIRELTDGSRILIAEACTHHPTCEDIGRVKLPAMLKKATGKELEFVFAPGRDFPEDLTQFQLIIHCGSCMLNRQETLYRLQKAKEMQVPVTNYGMAISYCQGVLDKVLIPQ